MNSMNFKIYMAFQINLQSKTDLQCRINNKKYIRGAMTGITQKSCVVLFTLWPSKKKKKNWGAEGGMVEQNRYESAETYEQFKSKI